MAWYQLWDFAEPFPPSDALIVRMPKKLRSKEKVHRVLQEALQLPHYFESNWDALEEVLRDLSWLKAKRVVIVHQDVPFGQGDNRQIYLEILENVVEFWQEREELKFEVVFPVGVE